MKRTAFFRGFLPVPGMFLHALLAVLLVISISEASTKVRIGIYQNPPLVFYEEPERPGGIYIDILKYIAKREDWEVEYVPCNWDDCLRQLEEGEIDIQTSTAYSEERAQRFLYNKENIFINWAVVYANKNSEIDSITDLKDKRIAMLRDDIYVNEFLQMVSAFGVPVHLALVESYDDVFKAVNSGQVDAGVVNRLCGLIKESRFQNIKKTSILFSPVELRLAFSKKGRLGFYDIKRIDSYIKNLKEDKDSVYHKSIERYTGVKPVTRLPGWVKWTLVVISSLIGMFLAISLWLRSQVKRKTEELSRRLHDLEQSRNYIKTIYDATPDMIFIHDVDGRVLDVNDSVTQYYGYTPEEFKNLSPEKMMGRGYNFEMALDKIRLALEGSPQEFEWVARRKDGTEFPVEVRLRRITFTHKNGRETPAVLAIVRDITEKKESEKRIKEEQERIGALMEAIPDLIFRITRDGRFIDYKDSYLYPLYAPPEVFLGKKMREVLPQDVAEKAERAIKETFETGQIQSFEYSLTIEGKLRYYEARIKQYTQDEVVAIIRDITDRKEAERFQREYQKELERIVAEKTEELKKRVEEVELLNRGMLNLLEDLQAAYRKSERLARRLQESNQELEAFAYSVSHDLRAPLRAMQGFSEALLQDYGDSLDETGREYARRILMAAQRMDNLIQDLLAYSRLTRQRITLRPISLEDVLNEARRALEVEIKERDALIQIEKPLPKVLAARNILYQVILNLISNAIKFVKKETRPEVRIWAEEKGDTVRVNIQDNGIGIAEEYHERIFKIFERLHGIERYPGTGIGLAIVKRGVEKIGGSVGLVSEPGKGSRFWIELKKA